MGSILRFAFVAVIAFIVLTVLSVGWSKFSVQPRPDAIKIFHGYVKDTYLAKQTAQVLGVTDSTTSAPMSFSSIASDFKTRAIQEVSDQVRLFIVSRLAIQLMYQFNALPESDRSAVTSLICKPDSGRVIDATSSGIH